MYMNHLKIWNKHAEEKYNLIFEKKFTHIRKGVSVCVVGEYKNIWKDIYQNVTSAYLWGIG